MHGNTKNEMITQREETITIAEEALNTSWGWGGVRTYQKETVRPEENANVKKSIAKKTRTPSNQHIMATLIVRYVGASAI